MTSEGRKTLTGSLKGLLFVQDQTADGPECCPSPRSSLFIHQLWTFQVLSVNAARVFVLCVCVSEVDRLVHQDVLLLLLFGLQSSESRLIITIRPLWKVWKLWHLWKVKTFHSNICGNGRTFMETKDISEWHLWKVGTFVESKEISEQHLWKEGTFWTMRTFVKSGYICGKGGHYRATFVESEDISDN